MRHHLIMRPGVERPSHDHINSSPTFDSNTYLLMAFGETMRSMRLSLKTVQWFLVFNDLCARYEKPCITSLICLANP
jgi:hypothetical protein